MRLLHSDLSPLLRPPHVAGSPRRVRQVTEALPSALPSARASRVVALSPLGAPSPTGSTALPKFVRLYRLDLMICAQEKLLMLELLPNFQVRRSFILIISI